MKYKLSRDENTSQLLLHLLFVYVWTEFNQVIKSALKIK